MVRVPVGDDRVLGPARPGVVTMAGDGVLSWRRPGADAAPIPVPSDRTAIDAGGELVLVEAPVVGDGIRRFETWSIVGARLVQTFAVRTSDGSPRLAPDGGVAALPERTGFVVHDATSGERIAAFPLSGFPDAHPVWVGGTSPSP